ncbi:Serine/threonine protein kinase [Stigmatella aurantiaca]|uniref:Serine/threonine protein kinase n=1 Tax=Stigmatella aurantiaca TaxID=41 RepID=A0A1H8CMX1_STIAU|nr:serine/threonine-protein kinase [Stigmatella aurantiaca]SEM96269.1 Serine/threonine protein kinase [Stigmatella aurantiaca]
MLRPAHPCPHCILADHGPLEFGKYVLLSKLAAGGMAVTYRARMTGAAGVTKPCVIKQILPHFADDADFVEMFISEARVAMGLSHGNIAQVFDFGEVDGQYFIALEFVYGQPLSKVLRRTAKSGLGFLPIPLALHVVSKLCDGLDYAHRHVGEDGEALGLVHRDVSPDNVLLSYEGEVKVIDFGIAKATSIVESKTSPGVVKGKYPYFSPEQAQGRQDLDLRTDVYAAGVVLYEAVCGRRPYEGEFVTVLPRILRGDYTPPSELNPAISPELEGIIASALALDRDERYPTAKALSDALVELLYRENPRFTPTLLSQFVAHLFSEELSADGRKVEVPAAFREQLASWQKMGVDPALTRAKTPSVGSAPRSRSNPGTTRAAGSGARQVSSGARSPNDSGPRPASNGSRKSDPRRSTGLNVPTSGVRRALGSDRPGPSLPDATDDDEVTPAHPSLMAPLDGGTQPALASPSKTVIPPTRGADTTLEVARALKAHEEQERAEQRQTLVRKISLGMLSLALVIGVLYGLSSLLTRDPNAGQPPTATVWVTSTPPGAEVALNGRMVKGKTPLFVNGFVIDEANTVVLTLPGRLPWTKRFTPDGRDDPPLHAELQKDPSAVEPAPAEGTPPEPGKASPADAGVAAVVEAPPPQAPPPEAPPAQPGSGPEREFQEVLYPTRLLVLRTQYNALPVPEYTTASIELNPGTTYSLHTEGGAAYTEGSPTSNTLAYFLEGDMPADDSFGLLSGTARPIKGAKRIHVFALDETGLEDNRGTVRVQLFESKWKPPRYLLFEAQKHALPLKPGHQMALRGLNPKSTYLFTVRDDFAELRSGTKGRVRRVLCMERGADAEKSRRTYRVLEVGKRYQLDGLETLRCTFPDTRVEDNAGALAVDLVDVTNMTRREREEYIRNARRTQR